MNKPSLQQLAVAVAARDWFAISPGSRVRSVGVWFVMGAAIVIAIFGWSWIARTSIS